MPRMQKTILLWDGGIHYFAFLVELGRRIDVA
jgi:hypothetical protein